MTMGPVDCRRANQNNVGSFHFKMALIKGTDSDEKSL